MGDRLNEADALPNNHRGQKEFNFRMEMSFQLIAFLKKITQVEMELRRDTTFSIHSPTIHTRIHAQAMNK